MTEYGRIHTDGSRSGGQPVLLPCPFCGKQPWSYDDANHSTAWEVECGNTTCSAQPSVWKTTKVEAIAAWNTRQPTQSDALREVVIEECAKALEADAKKRDCFALEERECGCGAWCEWKSITSARAVEIVRALANEPFRPQAPKP